MAARLSAWSFYWAQSWGGSWGVAPAIARFERAMAEPRQVIADPERRAIAAQNFDQTPSPSRVAIANVRFPSQ